MLNIQLACLVAVLILAPACYGFVSKSSAEAQNMTLKQVQVFTRHGARAPFASLINYNVPWYCEESILEWWAGNGDSISIPFPGLLYRKRYMLDRQEMLGNCSQGQLTLVGAEMHRELGASLRARYVTDLGFISNYTSTDIFLRSTDVPRTFESAENLVTSLFPPSQAPPGVTNIIDILTIDNSVDDMVLPPIGSCPQLLTLCQLASNSPTWAQKELALAPIKAQLMSILNLTEDNFPPWFTFFDDFTTMAAHNISWPMGVTQQMYNNITSVVSWELTNLYATPGVATLGIGRFIGEIYDNIISEVAGKPGPKFFLYSAHDVTLALILTALQIFDGVWPPYASHLVIETWEDDFNDYFVALSYQGNSISLPGCEGIEFCPVTVLLNIASEVIPANYDNLCNSSPMPSSLTFATSILC